ncbi:MAG: hypothetical protein ACK41D_05650 [Rubricoccaceae bacterium]
MSFATRGILSRLLGTLLLALLSAAPALAQQPGELRRIVLTDGRTFAGVVEDENADPVVVIGSDGVRRQFQAARVAQITPLVRGRFFRTDPVGTSLVVAPTARTQGRGNARLQASALGPGVTVGLTDRLDFTTNGFLVAGSDFVVTPQLGLKAQLFQNESVAFAAGFNAVIPIGGGNTGDFLSIPYAVVSLGDETRAFHAGMAGLVGRFGQDDVEIANGVLLGLGGDVQLNNGVKLIGEALIPIEAGVSGVLFLPGVRFFGNNFSFDVIGFLAIGDGSAIGFAPIPARVSYRF